MKKAAWWLVMAFLVGLGLAGCTQEPPKPKEVTKEQLKEQAGKLVADAKEMWQQQQDRFLQDYNARLQGLHGKIDELKAKLATAPPEMKEKLAAILKQMEEQQAALAKMAAASKDATGKTWDDLKASLDEGLKEMDQKLADTFKQKSPAP